MISRECSVAVEKSVLREVSVGPALCSERFETVRKVELGVCQEGFQDQITLQGLAVVAEALGWTLLRRLLPAGYGGHTLDGDMLREVESVQDTKDNEG